MAVVLWRCPRTPAYFAQARHDARQPCVLWVQQAGVLQLLHTCDRDRVLRMPPPLNAPAPRFTRDEVATVTAGVAPEPRAITAGSRRIWRWSGCCTAVAVISSRHAPSSILPPPSWHLRPRLRRDSLLPYSDSLDDRRTARSGAAQVESLRRRCNAAGAIAVSIVPGVRAVAPSSAIARGLDGLRLRIVLYIVRALHLGPLMFWLTPVVMRLALESRVACRRDRVHRVFAKEFIVVPIASWPPTYIAAGDARSASRRRAALHSPSGSRFICSCDSKFGYSTVPTSRRSCS